MVTCGNAPNPNKLVDCLKCGNFYMKSYWRSHQKICLKTNINAQEKSLQPVKDNTDIFGTTSETLSNSNSSVCIQENVDCPIDIVEMPQPIHRHLKVNVEKFIEAIERENYRLAQQKKSTRTLGPVLCEICGLSFKSKCFLKRHMLNHDQGNDYVCETCGKSLRSFASLQQHIMSHSEVRPFQCEDCPKNYKRRSHLRDHRRDVHQIPLPVATIRKFVCENCHKRFFTDDHLQIHMRRHIGDMPFPCDDCPQSFSSLAGLRLHKSRGFCNSMSTKKYLKDGRRRRTCKWCGKQFATGLLLREHKRALHAKPYECDVCKQQFKVKGTLVRHYRQHTDERPFLCQLCPKRFRRAAMVVIHMRTHTGEKPYLCVYCGRGFAQDNDRKKHEKIHERQQQVTAGDSGTELVLREEVESGATN